MRPSADFIQSSKGDCGRFGRRHADPQGQADPQANNQDHGPVLYYGRAQPSDEAAGAFRSMPKSRSVVQQASARFVVLYALSMYLVPLRAIP